MPAAETTAQDLTDVLQALQTTAAGRKTVWGTPIPWNARPVFASGFVVAPAYGAAFQVIVATYQVPRGYSALLCGLVLGFVGAGSALPGQVLYTVDVDSPTAVPVPGVGYAEKDFAFVPFQLGSFVPGDPWPVEFKHDELETVRIKAQTVAGVPIGAGNFVFGALVGWQWPSMGWER
jgi:hypothetical protein